MTTRTEGVKPETTVQFYPREEAFDWGPSLRTKILGYASGLLLVGMGIWGAKTGNPDYAVNNKLVAGISGSIMAGLAAVGSYMNDNQRTIRRGNSRMRKLLVERLISDKEPDSRQYTRLITSPPSEVNPGGISTVITTDSEVFDLAYNAGTATLLHSSTVKVPTSTVEGLMDDFRTQQDAVSYIPAPPVA